MEHRGLHTSIWARDRDGDVQSFCGIGDWVCSSCGFLNFQRRMECFQCSFSAIERSIGPDAEALRKKQHRLPNYALSPSQTTHHTDHDGNHELKQSSSQVHIASGLAEDTAYHVRSIESEGRGLITSRWAPRNRSRVSDTPDDSEIWTRVVVPAANVTSNPHLADAAASSDSTALHLSLPYEVQHYILSIIQRTLEEACYEFATRWIPSTLSFNNWSCAEAVELSTWRKVLPAANLPNNTIVPLVQNYSLDSALADAVRIRNAAVHRHLCSTVEIRTMALKAQALMTMFADGTRQSKFQRLEEELEDWDIGKGRDAYTKRRKLQEALQEISERSMDEMDWTPNEVSLTEITTNIEPFGDTEEFYRDKMELD